MAIPWHVFLCLVFYTISDNVQAACNATARYRTLDGSCNNLQNPSWGAVNTPYGRLIAADYGDGVKSPRKATNGADLPSARTISNKLFSDANVLDPAYTLINMQFGQIVAHDMGFTAGGVDVLPCCGGGQPAPNPVPRCYPIPVASDDPVMGSAGVQCLDFLRTITDCDTVPSSCSNNKKAEQINSATSFLDLSLVYGNSVEENTPLRQFTGGLMKVERRNGSDWPPRNPQSSDACVQNNPDDACYLTGDPRANLSPHLAILHITFLREHNRIAKQLALLNPPWNDEKLFQEARRINIAEYQQIVYYEWLPNFLGWENMEERGIINEKDEATNFYQADVNPTTLNSNANAAFRYFHSAAIGHLQLANENRTSDGDITITDHTLNPNILEAPCKYAQLSRGMSTQQMGKVDRNIDYELKNNFFKFGGPVGSDLRSIDIQRARDHGLPSYNKFRKWCKLKKIKSFADLGSRLNSPKLPALFASVYTSVEDVELTVAGFFEKHLENSQAGETFQCILEEQFYRTRVGDRFFFETNDKHLSFSHNQLSQIRKATMARVLCDNTVGLEGMQPDAFLSLSSTNTVKPCSKLPAVDLNAWKSTA
ncbi:oxidase/peroxidase [Anopheles darlingi]|uniref:Oxidase/peroxidase n=1 Tax=Anopheles darlingi TaxID=43151 RepID=W5JRW3_ANODA|nr:oxidase/peroxidase [Anopheles darlingi]